MEQPSLLRLEREDRQERHCNDEEREEQRRAHLARRLDQDFRASLAGGSALQMLVGVLDHDDGGVDHGADGNGDAAQAHDVGRDPERVHEDVGDEDAQRQRQDGNQRAARMQQEDDAHERNDQAFLGECRLERRDRALDQLGAVVDGHDLGAGGQAGGNLRELCLHVVDDGERVLAKALHGDAGDGLAFAVELGDTAAFVRHQLHAGDVAQQHRSPVLRLQDDLLDVLRSTEVAAPAHHELGLGQLHHAAAYVHVRLADGVAHLGQRDLEGLQASRIDDDRVLAHEAADAGDLGHAVRLGDGEADLPVLRGSELGKRALGRHHGVLVDPADAGRVGTQRRRHAIGKLALGGGQIFEHARTRPVEVGAVLEDDVHEAHAEEREAAHDARLGHAQERRRQREGHLVLHHLRRLARVFGVDDDLGVGEVGDGVERHLAHGVDAGAGEKAGAQKHKHQVAGRPADDGGDHGAGLSWLS